MGETQVTFTVLLSYTIINPHYANKPVVMIENGDKLHGYAVFDAWNHITDGHPLQQCTNQELEINKFNNYTRKAT